LFDKNKELLIAYPPANGNGNYTIPGSVKAIGENAFCESASLTSITIPDSVIVIEYYAFANCNNLISVTFNGTIKSNLFYEDSFDGDLRAKFYATDTTDGTPGTYTRPSGSDTWTKE